MAMSVTGVSKNDKRILIEAAELFAAALLHKRTINNLIVEIEVYKNLDVDGECVNEDDTRNPRWFTIKLKKQDLNDMVKALAHEMVHVKQYARNELKSAYAVPAKNGFQIRSKWMGQVWNPKPSQDSYFDSPWEIEAYGREVGLFYKWFNRK